jgi:hypothetical protein
MVESSGRKISLNFRPQMPTIFHEVLSPTALFLTGATLKRESKSPREEQSAKVSTGGTPSRHAAPDLVSFVDHL